MLEDHGPLDRTDSAIATTESAVAGAVSRRLQLIFVLPLCAESWRWSADRSARARLEETRSHALPKMSKQSDPSSCGASCRVRVTVARSN